MIKGFATPEGTAAYQRRMTAAPSHFRDFQGLTLSTLGIGTYLGAEDEATDRAYASSVTRALQLGINVVDTAVNYRHQRSERSVGGALRSLIASGGLAREEVIVATKGGFIPFDGAAPADPRAYVAETYHRTGLVAPDELVASAHCLAPRYLADQIDRSRANLGLETVDVYYLHNPETQLGAVDRRTFLRRMRAAFEQLETSATAGKIRVYGTATWAGYRQPLAAKDALSLAELVQLAAEVGGAGHRFRALQCPYNLGMTEAFTVPTQRIGEDTVSALEAARRLDVYCMT